MKQSKSLFYHAILSATLLQGVTYAADPDGIADVNRSPVLPGQCWIYGQIQPKPITSSLTVTLKDSHTGIEITPAEMQRGYKQVVTREGTVTYAIRPPTYKQVEEKVLIRPEMPRFVEIPAVYEQQHKRVVLEEARTVLEECRAAGTKYSQGAVAFCAREIPAKEKVIPVQVLVQEAQTRVEVIPAQYETITKWVVDKPAEVVEVSVEPRVNEIAVETVIRPEQSRQYEVPAITREMPYKAYAGETYIVMRRAVCDADLTSELITLLQQHLHARGYDAGPVDGLLGKRTLEALSHYQVDAGLAVGAVTYESLESLGISE